MGMCGVCGGMRVQGVGGMCECRGCEWGVFVGGCPWLFPRHTAYLLYKTLFQCPLALPSHLSLHTGAQE